MAQGESITTAAAAASSISSSLCVAQRQPGGAGGANVINPDLFGHDCLQMLTLAVSFLCPC